MMCMAEGNDQGILIVITIYHIFASLIQVQHAAYCSYITQYGLTIIRHHLELQFLSHCVSIHAVLQGLASGSCSLPTTDVPGSCPPTPTLSIHGLFHHPKLDRSVLPCSAIHHELRGTFFFCFIES